MAIKEFVTTAPTFHEGKLYAPNSLIRIDTDVVQLEGEKGKPGSDDYRPSNHPNLAKKGEVPVYADGPMGSLEQALVDTDDNATLRDRMADLEAKLALLAGASNANGNEDAQVIEEGNESALRRTDPTAVPPSPEAAKHNAKEAAKGATEAADAAAKATGTKK